MSSVKIRLNLSPLIFYYHLVAGQLLIIFGSEYYQVPFDEDILCFEIPVCDGGLALSANDGHVEVVQARCDREGHVEQLWQKDTIFLKNFGNPVCHTRNFGIKNCNKKVNLLR